MKSINVIGAGLIGQERFKAVRTLQSRDCEVRLGSVYDPYNPKLPELAATHGFTIETDLQRFLAQSCDLLVVACPHDSATEHTYRALGAGHTVLIEKPVGRNIDETALIANAAQEHRLYIGLNYRFMPGIAALLTDWRSGRFGAPISVRLQMGHGGKPGDDKTWKLDPVRCGGGALLDPGIHLLDLLMQMTDQPPTIQSLSAWQGFWRTGIEEDVHLLVAGSTFSISIEVSVVRWRSHFEIFALGTDGYGQVTGRGRSYGRQIYRRGRRWGWQSAKDQASSEEIVVDDACENSFADELASCLGFGPPPPIKPAQLSDGLAVMKLYQEARTRMLAEYPNLNPNSAGS